MTNEPTINIQTPILEQRRYWYASPAYCKTLLSRVPLRWSLGFHQAENQPLNCDGILLHLHRMDYNMTLERHEKRRNMKWCENDLAIKRGFQNRIVGSEFDKWFYEDRNEKELGTTPQPIVEIPESLRKSILL